jgi:hypothetical protein
MSRFLLFFSLLALTANPTPCRGQGFLDWHWSFDQATYVVGPSDSVLLTATIFVRPESLTPVTGRAAITFQGSLFALYDFDCGFCRELGGANIPPGGSLQFTFGTLTPKSPIAPGTYRNFPDQPLIEFQALDTRRISDSPLVIQVVPEPSILALAFCGMLLGIAKHLLRRTAKIP